jgi:predicted phosphate transport protein (TIGR00153 family)
MIRLLPKEEKYFSLFNSLALQLGESARLLQTLFSDFDNRASYAERIKVVEHKCDEITHEIIKKLNQTFITPIDREDIHSLASGLDDIVDAIEYTAKRVILYHVAQSTEHARKMTDVMVRLTAHLQSAVGALGNNGEQVLQDCIAIHTLENEGDTYHHQAVEKLFAEEQNPITIIKMKEIYEKLERMIDKAEDVANVLEAIVLKNA